MAFDYAVALTGGIATGKSTVAKIFKSYGFAVIDADKIAHDTLNKEASHIGKLFGEEYLKDGEVNRKALGQLIFSDPQKKLELEHFLHPLIQATIETQAKEMDLLKKVYLVDIPLFFETNRYPIKESIVVYVPADMQLERLKKRDGSTTKEALSRIESQIKIEEKKHKATYLIDNQGDLNALQQECDRVKNILISKFKE